MAFGPFLDVYAKSISFSYFHYSGLKTDIIPGFITRRKTGILNISI